MWLDSTCGPVCQSYFYGSALQQNEQRPPNAGEVSIHQPVAGENPSHPEYYTKKDLEAQQSMANSTASLVMLTVMTIVLGVLGTIAIVFTLLQTNKAVIAAQEMNAITANQSRAWMKLLPTVEGRFQVTDREISCEIPCNFINVGTKPAIKARNTATIIQVIGTTGYIDIENQDSSIIFDHASVIFPGDKTLLNKFERYTIVNGRNKRAIHNIAVEFKCTYFNGSSKDESITRHVNHYTVLTNQTREGYINIGECLSGPVPEQDQAT